MKYYNYFQTLIAYLLVCVPYNYMAYKIGITGIPYLITVFIVCIGANWIIDQLNKKPKKYDYQYIVTTVSDKSTKKLSDYVNQSSKAGWQLVNMFEESGDIFIIFKKKVYYE